MRRTAQRSAEVHPHAYHMHQIYHQPARMTSPPGREYGHPLARLTAVLYDDDGRQAGGVPPHTAAPSPSIDPL
eukprot:GDKH01005308.1.p1 GENE.GDKH01005308.1~~GDKH01005308.1.p1  ORF type:complete len:73 (+),score=8.49 GDKH01005308.1:72-290(+)